MKDVEGMLSVIRPGLLTRDQSWRQLTEGLSAYMCQEVNSKQTIF